MGGESQILITGGAGYVGSHTCKYLSSQGITPVVLDNLATGHADNVLWGPFYNGDTFDGGLLTQIFRTHSIDAVLHFAGSAYVEESVQAPEKYYQNNVVGSLSLLEACLQAGVKKFVFSSSCATYGIPDRLPIDEQSEQQPINPYGRTKLMVENMLADFAVAHGLRFVALRYFNAAGADPERELRERHDPETRLIPRALMAASGQIKQIEIFGNDFETPDGTCVRDYIHVGDLARAHHLALRYLNASGGNLFANLGTGRGISINQILAAVTEITGRIVPAVIRPRRHGDPPALFAQTALAKRELGFVTRLSDLDTIIRTAAPGFGLDSVT